LESRKNKNLGISEGEKSQKPWNNRNLGNLKTTGISESRNKRNLGISYLRTSLSQAKTRRKIIYRLSVLTFMLAGSILYNILHIHQFLSFINRRIELFDPWGIKIPVQSNFLSFFVLFQEKNIFPKNMRV
jgi:hypothetical protein